MTFATIEARINAAALAKLANCTATVAGVVVAGIFDNSYADIYSMDGLAPSMQCATSDVSTAMRGTAVVVNSVSYTVAGIEPDGTGMTRLVLEKV